MEKPTSLEELAKKIRSEGITKKTTTKVQKKEQLAEDKKEKAVENKPEPIENIKKEIIVNKLESTEKIKEEKIEESQKTETKKQPNTENEKKIANTIALELGIKTSQVINTINLINEGNTIPFIARYRKEVTGGLSDETLRDLGERLTYLRNLEARKEEVIKSIDEQGKLTKEIEKSVETAQTLAEVEDIYRPYKQKKKTRATVAKAKGLEPLAKIIWEQTETKDIKEIAKEYINIDKLSEEEKKNKDKVVATVEDAIQGALDIIAEDISDNAKYRKEIKRQCYREATIVTSPVDEEEKSTYEMYYDYSEKIKLIPSHRILAINRGEKEKYLKVKIEKPEEKILAYIERDVIKGQEETQFTRNVKRNNTR